MAEIKKLNIEDLKTQKEAPKKEEPKKKNNNNKNDDKGNKDKKATDNKEEKKDPLWKVPVISGIIAVVVVALVLSWNSIAGLFGGGSKFDTPFTDISVNETVTKIKDNKEFMVLAYAEDCPYCKEMLFGAQDAKSGNGPLVQYSKETTVEIRATWAKTGEDMTDALAPWFKGVEDKLEEENIASKFDWRSKIYDYENGSWIIKPSSNYSQSERPGVPALMYFNNGELKGILEGSRRKSEILSWYTLVSR